MAKDVISVYLPDVDASQSVAYTSVESFVVNPENGIVIEKATENKNNSLSILAGDTYPDRKYFCF